MNTAAAKELITSAGDHPGPTELSAAACGGCLQAAAWILGIAEAASCPRERSTLTWC
jgi:hypothetical protein